MFLSKLKFGTLILMSVIAFSGVGFAAYSALRPQPISPAALSVPSQEKKPANEKQAIPQRAAEPEETDLVGEKVLPANKAPNDAPLRPITGTPLYKLTDLRVGGTQLTVHYERVVGEERGEQGPTLVIRTPDGNEISTIGGFGPFAGKKKAGDYVVNVRRRRRPSQKPGGVPCSSGPTLGR